jgi:hypothetical protein
MENSVSSWAHAWDQITRRESRLFRFNEVVSNISVENNFADLDEGVVLLGDDLGGVEQVPLILGNISLRNCLNIQLPFSCLTRI